MRPSEVTTQKPRTSTPNLPDVIQETKILKGGGGIFFRKPFPEVTAPTPIITRKPEKRRKQIARAHSAEVDALNLIAPSTEIKSAKEMGQIRSVFASRDMPGSEQLIHADVTQI